MVLAAGAGGVAAGTSQLVAHAATKSALFLAAGTWLTALGTKALPALRGAARRFPLVGVTFTVAAASLAGLPPLSLWVTKDEVLAAALARSPALYATGLAGAVISAVYSAKAAWFVWQPEPAEAQTGWDIEQPGTREVASPARAPLVALAGCAAVRVVRNATFAARTRCGSRHQNAMSAQLVAPITSHPISSSTSPVAVAVTVTVTVTVTSMAPANSSMMPVNLERASSGPNSPEAKSSTARVTAATVTTRIAESPSTAIRASIPASNGAVASGRRTAPAIASARVTGAAATPSAGATRSVRRPVHASSAPAPSGTATSNQASIATP